jgi:hypothetical protein
MKKPLPGDYSPYYQDYIDSVVEDDALKFLREQLKAITDFFNSITEEKGKFSYAKGKWTVKEVIGHIIDTERIMAYRALCIARGEKQPLPGFDQDSYVANAKSNNRKISELVDEFRKVRESNIVMFYSLDEDSFNNRGVVSGKEVTVKALLFIVAGHCAHHINVLKEKYLV